ncbi:MAG: Crp/Fnr family transcriptional regulator [Bacteroidetes bacterium]|jgi:CRP-like cAMP-binding protein|nr:Crp/Fnr family transcriptional regulator [Bacteroidota bacterium]MBT5528304.1 Crp/Fnr family transcriptional regulator [Cytophagia bacterium]MBT3802432.1 Crp/Fnr family transcriptional regulator [Bacteroidota bacterium]MBT3934552.1 Crp/Fnr family transcriptional regulator [Bacteroidota bacterium]MBT4340167.1 Crp/Fnr family transcriptional regulator [Bacteroidota bacterium]
MEYLIKKIKESIILSIEAEEYLISISKEKIVPKGSILIRQGQRVNKIFFVTGGCLRSYCIDKNGKEHTLHFAIKNDWISDYIAIHGNESATLTIECLTESNIIEFNAEKINGMLKLFPELEPFQRGNLERLFVSLQKRILNQLQLSAAERYDLFLEEYPDVEQHTRNYHIASYLGITQESLSRIRVEKARK